MVALAHPILDEIEYWARLGVPVLPGALGQKGAWPKGWPEIPAEETWARSRASAARPINLAVRLGPTRDGSRVLAHIDLDGKCPCGGDLTDHEAGDGRLGACHGKKCQQRGCVCQHYAGVAPDEALVRLKALLPELPLLVKTRRGYHAYFWSPCEYSASVLPDFGADVAANCGALSVIPPSVHPSGTRYEYLHKPLHDLPLIDLDELGLHPVSKAQPRPTRQTHSGSYSSATPLALAAPDVQEEFAELFRMAGVFVSGRNGDGAHICPWHADTEASLSVHAEAALFHCFGCGEGGGIGRLRTLVGVVPPTCNPFHRSHEELREGLQLGGEAVGEERDRLATALEEIGETPRAGLMRECRRYAWDAPESLETFACPTGDATPVQHRMNSCDDPQCPTCMPWRLAADWRVRWERRGEQPPGDLTLVALEVTETSNGLEDRAYVKRVRGRFREWWRARGIAGGFYGLLLRRDGDSWRAVLIVAIASGDVHQVTESRAFTTQILTERADSSDLIRLWQQAYLDEATAWQSLEELRAFRLMTHGRRKFQGFGEHFGTAPSTEKETEMSTNEPLHGMSGGSGRAAKRQPTCPRCGERLKRTGRFDPERMEIVVSDDGVPEWRWKRSRERGSTE